MADKIIPRRAGAHAGRRRVHAKAFSDDRIGMAWWNHCSDATRTSWLASAGSAIPAQAWECFKRSSALAETDTMQDNFTSKTLASATPAALGEIT